jgi:protein-S-isoprenylcysteine O-methyltransferase Ste14
VISILNVPEDAGRETDQFNQLQYVFIDDPVSSLDDNHLIELAVDLARLIKSSNFAISGLKFIITTHNPLFFNVLYIPVSFLLFVYFFGIWGKKSVSQNIEATKSAFYAPSKLLTEGIYARVQHPMIIGDILGHFSLVLLTGGIYTCILFPIYVFIDLFMIKIQVKYSLEPYYKSELIVYRKKTPVLLDQKLLFIVLFMALLVICNFLNYTKII